MAWGYMHGAVAECLGGPGKLPSDVDGPGTPLQRPFLDWCGTKKGVFTLCGLDGWRGKALATGKKRERRKIRGSKGIPPTRRLARLSLPLERTLLDHFLEIEGGGVDFDV